MLSAEDKFQYWLDYAQNDFDTAQAMFDTGRWFYVYITCQQAIEKLVKGLYILYIDDNVPRIHLIASVFDKFADKLSEPLDDKYRELFETLTYFFF
jgi:HEPN domain-containing protein